MRIIAIDFDGTITEDKPYPEHANIRPDAYEYIPKLFQQGYTLVLWSSRNHQYLQEAFNRLKDARLYQYFTVDYSLFNYGYTGKLEADYYIDDRMCVDMNWEQVYNYILQKEKLKVNCE